MRPNPWDTVLSEFLKAVQVPIDDFADIMLALVKKGSPYLTGHNRRSCTYRMLKFADGSVGFEMFTESGYGGWLEVGSSRRAGTPYFRPSFEQTRKELASLHA
jgi:hypothetical protein